MSLHQLFLDTQVISEEQESVFQLHYNPIDYDHIRALRLKPGEHISVVDASSNYFEMEIVLVKQDTIFVRIACHLEHYCSNHPKVCLVQGLAKADKVETVLRQTTELGIDEFYPAQMKRSVVHLDNKKREKKLERYVSIARSAAMQAGRTSIPSVCGIKPLDTIVNTWKETDAVFLFWEEAPQNQTIKYAFEQLDPVSFISQFSKLWVVIGPEGGIDKDELQAILNSQAAVFLLSLGPTILRCETAGVVSCALVLSELRSYLGR